jgi:hypothetical protein
MAQWDDILRATLKAAGKAADEIEEIVGKIAKQVDTPAPKPATARTGEVSAAELARMSKAERSAYNASKNVADKASAEAGQKLSRAETKLANVKETEDIIDKTMSETMKTQFGQAGLATQMNKMYGAGFDVSENAILKRVEAEVYKAVSEAKDAGSPLSRDQVKELISTKTKEVTEQMTKAAEGSQKATATRIKNIKELTPEEARMSGVKTALVTQAAKAEKAGDSESFLDKLTRMAKDENLLPIMDKEGKQVTEEIIIEGKKMTVPKWETRAEKSLRLEKESTKAFSAKEQGLKPVLDDDGKQVFEQVTIDGKEFTVPKYTTADGKPYVHKKVPAGADVNPKDAAAKAASGKETESSSKLRAAQEEGVIREAREAAEKSNSPAAKEALAKITKEYERGVTTKEEYLAFLKGVPKITGKSVTKAQIEANEYNIKAQGIRSGQERAVLDAKLEDKFGKGYTTRSGEGGATEYVRADAPKSELKGRKWVRDASGKLVLVKK